MLVTPQAVVLHVPDGLPDTPDRQTVVLHVSDGPHDAQAVVLYVTAFLTAFPTARQSSSTPVQMFSYT